MNGSRKRREKVLDVPEQGRYFRRKRKCWKTHFQLVKGEKFEFKGWRQMLRIVSNVWPVFTTKNTRKAFQVLSLLLNRLPVCVN